MMFETAKHHANCSCTSMEGVEADLLSVWPEIDEFQSSRALVDALADAFPEVWSDESCYGRALTVQRLGRYLARSKGLLSHKNSKDVRGYCRRDVEELSNRG